MTLLWLWLILSPIILVFPRTDSANQSQSLMPPDFSEICHLQHPTERSNPIRIHCELTSTDNQTWRLETLREWINTAGNNQSDLFSYSITCDQSGGSLSLPWPMKCPRLVEISVRNCNVTDIFSDFGKPYIYSIPSQLTKLEIVDSNMVVRNLDLLRMFSQVENITSEYDCLHDKTVETLTYRNVSYVFEDSFQEDMLRCSKKHLMSLALPGLEDSSNSSLNTNHTDDVPDSVCDLMNMENILNLPKRMRGLKVYCNYEKLRVLDDSISSTLSVYHHRFLTKFSSFPVLESLNYSYNYIDVIPQELSDWTFYFNLLKYMDLSHNRITALTFKSSFNPVNEVYINVQYNNITTLTPQDLHHFRRQRKTFIDIRNNPINCDSDLKEFIAVISDPKTFTASLQKYAYILDMTCHMPLELRGRTLRSLKEDDFEPKSNPWVVPVVVIISVTLAIVILILMIFIHRGLIKNFYYKRYQKTISEAIKV